MTAPSERASAAVAPVAAEAATSVATETAAVAAGDTALTAEPSAGVDRVALGRAGP